MKLIEILSEATEQRIDNASSLVDPLNRWIALEHSPSDIKTILSHPFSKQFKETSFKFAYRVVFASYEKFNQTGKAFVQPQPEGFIAYSFDPNWGSSARSDFDYSGDMIRFKKKVNPTDLLLNFTALANALRKLGYDINDIDESEVWFKAIPYYTTFDKKEFVNAELADGTEIEKNTTKISKAKLDTFFHWVKRGADPLNAARQLSIPPEKVPELMTQINTISL